MHFVHLRFDGDGGLGATATNVAQNHEARRCACLGPTALDDMKIGSTYRNVVQLHQVDRDGARRDVPD